MAILYKLETFEGPLDLLLHLIDKAEVDIYDIPISHITDQYMEYLDSMQQLELEVTSEFLVMAATLLSIKSKLLLPKPPVINIETDEEELDPRAELVQKLIEYRRYKGIAEHLRQQELERSLIYSREPEDLSPYMPKVQENPVKGLHVADLVLAFQKVMQRTVRRTTVATIHRDEISVKDRIYQVFDMLQTNGGMLLFSRLLPNEELTREDIVVTFLAVLELMKMKKVTCYQHGAFEDIVIRHKEEASLDELPRDEIDY